MSANADRQRAYRLRQHPCRRVKIIPLPVGLKHLRALIRHGYLRPEEADDRDEIKTALVAFLDDGAINKPLCVTL